MPRKKWKRPDIVPSSNSGCVAHAFSVMRLALNYKSGLPEEYEGETWGNMSHTWDEIEQFAAASFPNHHLMAIRTNSSDTVGSLCGKDYLIAWAYREGDENIGHMVIGSPYRFGDMVVTGIIAVSIERKWR